MINKKREKRPLGVYIHIPFCMRKCRYCDFLSFPSKEDEMEQYVESLCEEICCFFRQYDNYTVTSVFFGGGTPSILSEKLTEKIFTTLLQRAPLSSDAEITTEANPGTLKGEKLRIYRTLGFNRLSIGLQTTVEKELAYLGRIHTYDDFCNSYEQAQNAGFENINVDLMSAIPYQTFSSYELSLKRVLSFDPAHISAYSLIVEEGTPFYEEQNLDLLLPDEDTERLMYDMTRELLEQRGYSRYEISNYAKPGKECRHNLIYWDRKDYIGFGLGASSCLNDIRFRNESDFLSYLKCPWKEIRKREDYEELTLKEQMEEAMILGLRKIAGVSKKEFFSRYGNKLEEVFGDVIIHYEKEGLLEQRGDRVRFTRRGLDVSNVVLCDFIT
ncbi:MAG: radical SAM family heme chaperone HemW [Lachnospiraceae bacterium]|nr:radical SAM family heme chaperone HemW [Lachnospiraceae bacterium]